MAQQKKQVRTLHNRLKIIDDDDDSFGQDWEELCRAQKYNFQSYVLVDCHVATSGIETVEELCEAFRSTRSVEEEDENEHEMVLSFAETDEALQKVKVFFFAQSGSDADRGHILGLEKSYFQLWQNSAKKQMTMYDFLLKSSFFNVLYSCNQCYLVVSQINRFPAFIVFPLCPPE
jgi:hypothetical protein